MAKKLVLPEWSEWFEILLSKHDKDRGKGIEDQGSRGNDLERQQMIVKGWVA